MGFVDAVKRQLQPLPADYAGDEINMSEGARRETAPEMDPADAKDTAGLEAQEAGVTAIEGAQVLWGKHGRWLIICG